MTLKPSLRPGEGFSYYILHVKCHRAKTIHLSPYLWLTFSPVNKSNSRNLQSFFKKRTKENTIQIIHIQSWSITQWYYQKLKVASSCIIGDTK
jgi:hypothetical protein